MSDKQTASASANTATNRAKLYQLVLFPMNNGATNVYYILTMNFIAYYANGVLGLALMFATTIVTAMRLFDAVVDPIIGALIDRTQGRFGKFRPFMILGNLIMIASALIMFFGIRVVPDDLMWLRYTCFVIFLRAVHDRLYVPDSLYPLRSDLSDQRSESAAYVHDFQYGSKPGGNGYCTVSGSDPRRDAGWIQQPKLL